MDKIDLVFVLLCIVLLLIMSVYIYQAEKYKNNAENLCLRNENRFCICSDINNLKVGEDVLEKNSS